MDLKLDLIYVNIDLVKHEPLSETLKEIKSNLWYKIQFYRKRIVIDFAYLSNAKLDTLSIIPKMYENYLYKFNNDSYDPDFDMNKVIAKIPYCKYLKLDSNFRYNKKFNLPPNITELYTEAPYKITQYSETLEVYDYMSICGEYDIFIPKFSNNIELVKIYGDSIDILSLNNISTTINTLILTLRKLNMVEIPIIWPINLKTLFLNIDKIKGNIGILPYGLEVLSFKCSTKYEYMLLFPPTLKKILFDMHLDYGEEYKYSEIFNTLPDCCTSIQIPFKHWKNIQKLPKECKSFNYYNCPPNVLEDLKSRYPTIEFTTDYRSIYY